MSSELTQPPGDTDSKSSRTGFIQSVARHAAVRLVADFIVSVVKSLIEDDDDSDDTGDS